MFVRNPMSLGEGNDPLENQPQLIYDLFGNVIQGPQCVDVGESTQACTGGDPRFDWSQTSILRDVPNNYAQDGPSLAADQYASIRQFATLVPPGAVVAVPNSALQYNAPTDFQYSAAAAVFGPAAAAAIAPAPVQAPAQIYIAPPTVQPVTSTVQTVDPLTGAPVSQVVQIQAPPPSTVTPPWQSGGGASTPYWTNAPAPIPPLINEVDWSGTDAPPTAGGAAQSVATGLTIGRLALALGSLFVLSQ